MTLLRSLILGTTCLIGSSGTHAAEIRGLVSDQRGKPIADAVLQAVPMDPKNLPRPGPPRDAVDQIDKQFVPYVKAIQVGTKVRFPNNDNIRHQVYSFSPAKKFELPLYAGTAAQAVSFDKAGVVVLGCNIHDWMVGYIYVSETPFFAKTGTSGNAIIEDLPAGEYVVRVWHPDMTESENTTGKHVTVTGQTGVVVEWRLPLKPTLRIPRISGDPSSGYP